MATEILSYENLDAIADLVNPITGLLAIGVALVPIASKAWSISAKRICAFIIGMLVTYGLMILDKKLNIWSIFGLDYSTHTAFALATLLFLSFTLRKYWLLWCSILICYSVLMLYQGYHTIGDISTTALAVGSLIVAPYFLLLRSGASPRSTASAT